MLQEVLPLFKSFKALSLSLFFSQSLLSDGALPLVCLAKALI